LASDQLAESILETIADLHYSKLHFIRVQLTSDTSIDSDILAAINNGDLLDDLQQINSEKWQQMNCWITSIEAPKTSNLVYSSIDQKYFNQAKAETLTDDVFDQIIKDFNKQPAFIKDEVSTDESKKTIFDHAGQILRENVVNPDDVEDDSK
jgi:exonuclease SbcD